MRILVVDDSEEARDLVEAALLSAGYQDVATAASAWDAFKFLDIGRHSDEEPARVDIVLLDIVMPEMDGIEACTRIRNDSRYSSVPIIMVTSLDDVENLSDAFVAGANDYITKPLNRVELLARVRAALRLKAELDRRQERERELLSFMSNWGDRRAALWIDETTGLFVGEVAEAYLTAMPEFQTDDMISIITLLVDRLDTHRGGHGEDAAHGVLAAVARAVRGTAATVGVVASAYRNGLIVLVAPELGAAEARALGETICRAVARLAISNSEAIAADHVTASIAVVSGQVPRGIDRAHLLVQAISNVKSAAAAGGNRVVAMNV